MVLGDRDHSLKELTVSDLRSTAARWFFHSAQESTLTSEDTGTDALCAAGIFECDTHKVVEVIHPTAYRDDEQNQSLKKSSVLNLKFRLLPCIALVSKCIRSMKH